MDIERVGLYTIKNLLGEGGMGSVFKAELRPGAGFVVVKLAHKKYLDILVGESNVLRNLHHENIIRILPVETEGRLPDVFMDVSEVGGERRPYMVLEYLEGGSLKDWIKRRGRLSITGTLTIARQIGAALQYAHGRNVIHLDVKPSNILLSGDGRRAVLSDFGIVRVGSGLSQGQGPLMGAPAYMAPERLTKGQPLDGRADMYSLGVVMYEVLAGRVPFVGGTPKDVQRAVLEETPPPPSQYNPKVPAALDGIVMKCLEKEKEARFPNAEEFLEALHKIKVRSPGFQVKLGAAGGRFARAAVLGGSGFAIAGIIGWAAILGIDGGETPDTSAAVPEVTATPTNTRIAAGTPPSKVSVPAAGTPTAAGTASPTPLSSLPAQPTSTLQPTSTSTPTRTATPTPRPPSPTPTETATPVPTATPTPVPSPTAAPTATPMPTPAPAKPRPNDGDGGDGGASGR